MILLYAAISVIAHEKPGTHKKMPPIKLLPIAKSIAIALVFFAFGRLLAIRWGNAGFLIAVILLTIFYVSWWAIHRSSNQDK